MSTIILGGVGLASKQYIKEIVHEEIQPQCEKHEKDMLSMQQLIQQRLEKERYEREYSAMLARMDAAEKSQKEANNQIEKNYLSIISAIHAIDLKISQHIATEISDIGKLFKSSAPQDKQEVK